MTFFSPSDPFLTTYLLISSAFRTEIPSFSRSCDTWLFPEPMTPVNAYRFGADNVVILPP